MRLLALVLALGLAACQVATPVQVPTPVRAVDRMIAHTAKLDGCTGVRIGGGKVLSAAHCLEDGMGKGDTYSGLTIEYVHSAFDYIVLTGDKPIERVRMPDAVIGERVYVVGYPVQLDESVQLTVTDGVYTGASDQYMERLTALAYYGNSGGGAWNEAGELVGIVIQIRPTDGSYGPFPSPFPGYTYMVPVDLIRPHL